MKAQKAASAMRKMVKIMVRGGVFVSRNGQEEGQERLMMCGVGAEQGKLGKAPDVWGSVKLVSSEGMPRFG